MKTEQQIQENIVAAQQQLVWEEGNRIPHMQGFVQALLWVITEEEEKKE